MSFVSLQFFTIAISAVLLYFLAPRKYRWYVLLASSCWFYFAAAGTAGFLTALASIAVTYFAAGWIEKTTGDRRQRRLYLTVAVVILIGVLAVFKITGHLSISLGWLVMPLGISYYTFSLVGYLMDVYYKKQAAEHNFCKLLLYALYFPKIMQGPISKFREIAPRLTEGHDFDYQRFCFGLQLMLFGYFKKLVIADRAAMLTVGFFQDLANYDSGSAILVLVTLLATLRHYCDFSGYMDIVIGLSQMMGIRLEENFKQPFFSRTAAEFWRRWHITLGVWFKDYVYMPLVIHPTVIKISGNARKRWGKRVGKSMLSVIPLAIVWVLTGLWHGTGISYVLWGVYWGTIIIISNVFAPELKMLPEKLRLNTDSIPYHMFQTLRTFSLFVLGLLLSTLVGWRRLPVYFRILFGRPLVSGLFNGCLYNFGITRADLIVLLAAIALLWIIEILQQKYVVREKIAGLAAPVRWIIYGLGLLAVVFFGIYGPEATASGFAYMFF